MFNKIKKIIKLWKQPDPSEFWFNLYIDDQPVISMPFDMLLNLQFMKRTRFYTLRFYHLKMKIDV